MLAKIIKSEAAKINIDAVIVAAIVAQESAGDVYAFRFEPGFLRRYIAGRSSQDLGGRWPEPTGNAERDERLNRLHRVHLASSWGLMQVMGQTAVELGFWGVSLEELWAPDVNISLGCRKLARLLLKLRSSRPDISGEQLWRLVYLGYNGGADQHYDDRVIARITGGDASRILNG